MSDQKLRDLERRWKESGTVEDEAAYLRERVRVGDLSPTRLRLAADCGHSGARGAGNTAEGRPSHDTAPGLWRAFKSGELPNSLLDRFVRVFASECLRALPGRHFSADQQTQLTIAKATEKIGSGTAGQRQVEEVVALVRRGSDSRASERVTNALSVILDHFQGRDTRLVVLTQLDTLNWPQVQSKVRAEFAHLLLYFDTSPEN